MSDEGTHYPPNYFFASKKFFKWWVAYERSNDVCIKMYGTFMVITKRHLAKWIKSSGLELESNVNAEYIMLICTYLEEFASGPLSKKNH